MVLSATQESAGVSKAAASLQTLLKNLSALPSHAFYAAQALYYRSRAHRNRDRQIIHTKEVSNRKTFSQQQEGEFKFALVLSQINPKESAVFSLLNVTLTHTGASEVFFNVLTMRHSMNFLKQWFSMCGLCDPL